MGAGRRHRGPFVYVSSKWAAAGGEPTSGRRVVRHAGQSSRRTCPTASTASASAPRTPVGVSGPSNEISVRVGCAVRRRRPPAGLLVAGERQMVRSAWQARPARPATSSRSGPPPEPPTWPWCRWSRRPSARPGSTAPCRRTASTSCACAPPTPAAASAPSTEFALGVGVGAAAAIATASAPPPPPPSSPPPPPPPLRTRRHLATAPAPTTTRSPGKSSARSIRPSSAPARPRRTTGGSSMAATASSYRTWHPQTDPSGCVYAHEHGDNPGVDRRTPRSPRSPARFGYIGRRHPMPDEPNGHDEAARGLQGVHRQPRRRQR